MHRPTWRTVLDVTASGAMIVASLVLISVFWNSGFRPRQDSSVPLPTDPVDLGDAAVLGDSRAATVIVVYSDFECPYCRRFAAETMPKLRARYIDTGQVLLAFRHLPLTTIHAGALRAAQAAICAGDQDRFWEYHDGLFSGTSSTPDGLSRLAQTIGLESRLFERCLAAAVDERIAADVAEAAALRITATPTFLIGSRVDGRRAVEVTSRIDGAKSMDEFIVLLDPLVRRDPLD